MSKLEKKLEAIIQEATMTPQEASLFKRGYHEGYKAGKKRHSGKNEKLRKGQKKDKRKTAKWRKRDEKHRRQLEKATYEIQQLKFENVAMRKIIQSAVDKRIQPVEGLIEYSKLGIPDCRGEVLR